MQSWERDMRIELEKYLQQHIRPEERVAVSEVVDGVLLTVAPYTRDMIATADYTLKGLDGWLKAMYPMLHQQDNPYTEIVVEVAYKLFNFFSLGKDVVHVIRRQHG